MNIVNMLIEKNADVNRAGNDGSTALMLAAANSLGRDILSSLIKAGANVNQRNKLDLTALHNAVSYGRLENLKILVQNGADVNCADKNKQTPLMEALQWENRSAVKILKDAGATIDQESLKSC